MKAGFSQLGEIQFKQIGEIMNDADYKAFFIKSI